MMKIPVECYTRTVGYFRPVSQMNKGKQEEVNERRDMLTKEYITKRKENESS